MTDPNIDALPARSFVNDAELAKSASGKHTIGQFEAAGMTFDVKVIGWLKVEDTDNGSPVGQNAEALKAGYPVCYRFVAVATDGDVYAVWEVYSRTVGNMTDAKSKTIEVDAEWCRQGIGTAFVKTVRTRYPVKFSDHFTPAGARLKDRVESTEDTEAAPTTAEE